MGLRRSLGFAVVQIAYAAGQSNDLLQRSQRVLCRRVRNQRGSYVAIITDTRDDAPLSAGTMSSPAREPSCRTLS